MGMALLETVKCKAPRTGPKLGLVLTLCEIDPCIDMLQYLSRDAHMTDILNSKEK